MVKHTQRQTGSAHIVIIVILVLVLLGVLGFVFWQNLTNNKNVKATAVQTSSQAQATSVATQDTSRGSLVLSDSNVKGTFATEWGVSAKPMTGGVSGNEVVGYALDSLKLTNSAQDKQGCAARAGTIQILNPGDAWTDQAGNKITIDQYTGQDAKKVGSHYYVYVDAYRCSGDVASLKLNTVDKDLLVGFRSASIAFIQSLQLGN